MRPLPGSHCFGVVFDTCPGLSGSERQCPMTGGGDARGKGWLTAGVGWTRAGAPGNHDSASPPCGHHWLLSKQAHGYNYSSSRTATCELFTGSGDFSDVERIISLFSNSKTFDFLVRLETANISLTNCNIVC